MKLRPYQEYVQKRVFDEWNNGVRKVLAVMPTGAGKTAMKSSITKILDVPTMAIAHRQELILQISESLATFGIQHKIIAPNPVIRFCNQRHIKLFGQSYTHGNDVMVASVQTLVRRQDRLRHLFGRIKLVDIDECFPSGTLVDGVAIEKLRVGDMITAFDETTGTYATKPIVAVMKNPMPKDMVQLRYGTSKSALTCTRGHPIWTRRGWVRAEELTNDDEVLHVRSGWQRIKEVSFMQSGGDGHVYNIEVADLHTYVADGLTVHNCHHVLPDNQWGKAFDLFPNARGLGVTATPLRCDGKPLSGSWETMVVGPTMRELITQGYLADYRIFCPPVSINTDQVRISKSSGEYVKADLIDASHESSIVGDVVSHYLRVAGGKRGLTFATDLASARRITDAYIAAGVPALYVDGDTPDKERIEASDKLRRGEVLQLVNVDLFGEGYDVPSVEVVSMARPTQSYGLYCQQFGRALRPSEGKPHAIILDHVGNVVRHGLPDRAVMWSLDGKRKRNAAVSDEIPLTVCAACLQPRERILKVCPYCDHVNAPASRASPMEVDGDLMELDPAVLSAMRGEIINVESGSPAIPYGATGAIVGRKVRDWNELCEAQVGLRDSISHWAGVWKYGADHDDSMLHRRFFLMFGIDVLGAMALRRADAAKLDAKIQGSLM